MEFNYIPSGANNYNFVICYKNSPDENAWRFYDVADTMNEAQNHVNSLKRFGAETLVIINISNYERGKR